MTDVSAQAMAIANALPKANRLVPVGTHTDVPFQLSSALGIAAGQQFGHMTRHFFPKGGKNVRVILPAGFVAGALEALNAQTLPIKASASLGPAPWNPATSYQVGQTVSYFGLQTATAGSFQYISTYVCAVANTNSPPKPGNPNWTVGSRANPQPMTFSGNQVVVPSQIETPGSGAFVTGAISGTTLTVSGTTWGTVAIGQTVTGAGILPGTTIAAGSGSTWTVNTSQTVGSTAIRCATYQTQAFVVSDPLPITIPAGSWLEIYQWLPCYGSQVVPLSGHNMAVALGGWSERGSSVSDRTLIQGGAGGFGAPSSASSNVMIPMALIGQPLISTKSVVVIGDSITSGITGTGNLASVTVSAGGSGYALGDLLTLSIGNGTAGAMANLGNAVCIVEGVTAGAVTAVRIVSTGDYTSTTSQTAQTLPSGATATTTDGNGTGCTLTPTFGTSGPFDPGDSITRAQGWIRRGLCTLGIPHATIASAGDRLSLWTSPTPPNALARMGVAGQLNADIAIVALGRNDLTNGDSVATMQANYASLVAMLKGAGIAKVYGCTITPEVTSTGAAGCSTVASQIVTGNNSNRLSINAWMRGGSSPFDAIIDGAALAENGGAAAPTGQWIVQGALATAADGKHPGQYLHGIMAGAITANAGLFQ